VGLPQKDLHTLGEFLDDVFVPMDLIPGEFIIQITAEMESVECSIH